MQIERLPDNYLFERHPKETVRSWLLHFRYFYFKRAWGGHANDGDEFQVAFSFTDREDLINKTGKLGLSLNKIPDDFPRLVIGRSYTGEEFSQSKSEIKAFPDLEQPGYSIIFGHSAFIWVYDKSIRITVAGTRDNNRYEVSEADFDVCIALERHFDALGWRMITDRSLEKSVCCISRIKYPELYEGEDSNPE